MLLNVLSAVLQYMSITPYVAVLSKIVYVGYVKNTRFLKDKETFTCVLLEQK